MNDHLQHYEPSFLEIFTTAQIHLRDSKMNVTNESRRTLQTNFTIEVADKSRKDEDLALSLRFVISRNFQKFMKLNGEIQPNL